MNYRLSLEVVGFFISLINFVAGFLLWYSASVKKDYAARRDFEHLKRQYEGLANNQSQILAEIDRLSDSVKMGILELKNSMTVLLHSNSKGSLGTKE